MGRIIFILIATSIVSKSCQRPEEQLIKDNIGLLTIEERSDINTTLIDFRKRKYDKQLLIYTINTPIDFESPARYTEQLLKYIDFGVYGFSNSLVIVIYYPDRSIYFRWGDSWNKYMSGSVVDTIIKKMEALLINEGYREGIKLAIREIDHLVND